MYFIQTYVCKYIYMKKEGKRNKERENEGRRKAVREEKIGREEGREKEYMKW